MGQHDEHGVSKTILKMAGSSLGGIPGRTGQQAGLAGATVRKRFGQIHCGFVGLTSKPGKTVFTVTLPMSGVANNPAIP